MAPVSFHAGTVAIVGRPNVGKSTLLNALVGAKLAITSRKAQTTRQRVHGVLTTDDAQLVFVDTPGFQERHKTGMNRAMQGVIASALGEVDAVILVIDAHGWQPEDERVLAAIPIDKPCVLALNKIDALKDKAPLLNLLTESSAKRNFAALVPVSATRNRQLKELTSEVARCLPEQPALVDAETLTDQPERFFAAEFIREKLFRLLGDEIPFSTAVLIERWQDEGDLARINAVILVDRASHKPIVIGAKGATLKRIGTEARVDIEELIGRKVFLELFVRVKEGWADHAPTLKSIGFT